MFGSVAEDILSLLPPLIGKMVSVDLERSVMLQWSGRTGRPTYRLLGIRAWTTPSTEPTQSEKNGSVTRDRALLGAGNV